MANRLINETSPYLLQHAHNPVDWFPWGKEAFEKANLEQKPVLVSIGYATCHWCHVMERESFENEEVAAYMNEHFVCIKLDREEHPDVDHFYMDALQAMKQSGGWPLNMFVTPDKKPFYGGTYFPPQKMYSRPSWMELLEAVNLTWQKKQSDIQHQAGQLLQYLEQTYQYETVQDDSAIDIDATVKQIALQYDSVNGGFSSAPKFPNFSVIRLLTHIAMVYKNDQAKEMVGHTLNKLMTSGIYDPVAGGLCRYATDAEWRVPHFEKMLYDNALFIGALAQMYAIDPQKKWMHTISQVVQFCQNVLQAENGLYASAMDADSEGVEGKYYVWSYEELITLNSFHKALAEYYDLVPEGNWEHGQNILHQVYTDDEIIEKFQFLPKQWTLMKQQFLIELSFVRQQRVAPIVDTKQILALNALLATGYLQAFKALGVEQYKTKGLALIDAIWQQFVDEASNNIYHLATSAQQDKILAKLDDIAYLLQALIQAYSIESTTNRYANITVVLDYVNEYFDDERKIMYYFSDKRQEDVLVRKIEQLDGAMLSSNAIMSENLWWLGQMRTEYQWIERSIAMTQIIKSASKRYPVAYGSWLLNSIKMQGEWSVVKKNCTVESFEHTIFYQQFLEQKLLFSASSESSKHSDTSSLKQENDEIYFQECFSGQCKTPVNSVFQIF